MKILITGAAGYIGSVLIDYLLKKKYQIIGADNLIYNQKKINLINKFIGTATHVYIFSVIMFLILISKIPISFLIIIWKFSV